MASESSPRRETLSFQDGNRVPEDILLEIYLEAYRDHPEYGETSRRRARRYLDWLRRHATLFEVAEVAGEPAGWMVVDANWEGDESAELHELVVRPRFQGKGVGSALLERAIAHARALGKRELRLWVGRGNGKAIAFYRKHGFEPLYSVGDWLRMRKRLEKSS